jgi:hypothetical protein
MSDLRTRIASALESADRIGYGTRPYTELADAVIRELGLIRDPFSTVAFCRYVTQWEPNERFRPNVETP